MIHHGDCVEVMAGMDPESVDALATLHRMVRNMRDFAVQNGERDKAEAYNLVMLDIERRLTLAATNR